MSASSVLTLSMIRPGIASGGESERRCSLVSVAARDRPLGVDGDLVDLTDVWEPWASGDLCLDDEPVFARERESPS